MTREKDKKKIAIGVSGSGTTFESIAQRIVSQELNLDLSFIFSDRECAAIGKAQKLNIPVVQKTMTETIDQFHGRVCSRARAEGVNLIALAGYLRLFPIKSDDPYVVINSHPGAIPFFGGAGFWGIRVHRAVLDFARRTNFRHPYTYSTIHIASAEYDKGPVVGIEQMSISEDDSPEAIAARLLPIEHQNYTKVLAEFAVGDLMEKKYPDGVVLSQEETILEEVRREVLAEA